MLNKVMIIGHLGADPELRYTQSGSPVATLRVATDESFTDREGNRTERTEWHRVVVFQRAAENCSQYLHKGSLVYVEGRLQTRKWQDQNGQDRFSTEIRADRVQFLDRRNAEGTEGGSFAAPRRPAPRQDFRQQHNRQQQQESYEEDPGPAFPSEASQLDDVPF